MMGETRNTFGWEYLEDGVPVVIVAAGLFALPELWEAYVTKYEVAKISTKKHNRQTWQGILEVWKNKYLALMGGAIGFVVGILPGTGGGIGDWTSYSATVAINKQEKVKFGEGNIKGVIGPEGANNASKMGGLLPTIMFGIPGGKVFALLMALWLYVGFEVGNSAIINDTQFINHLFGGYMIGTLLAGVIMLFFARQFSKIVYLKPLYWIPPMLGLIIWSVLASRYYSSVWEDLTVLVIFGMIGFLCKKYKFSRPALLMSYILFPRIEESYLQLTGIFFWDDFEAIGQWLSNGDTTLLSKHYIINNPLWLEHPTVPIAIILAVLLIGYGFINKKRQMDYT